jgi:hypothetical protein
MFLTTVPLPEKYVFSIAKEELHKRKVVESCVFTLAILF